MLEPSHKCQNILVQGNTTELKPGGSQVDVKVWNLSGRDVTLKPHTEVGMISTASKIPPMLAPKVVEGDDQDDEKIHCKSDQVDLDEAKLKQIEVDPEEIPK